MKLEKKFFLLIGIFMFLGMMSCQNQVQTMDPAAKRAAVKEQFVKKSMTLIDSMTAICDKRVEEATN